MTTNYEKTGYRFISSDYSELPIVGDLIENSFAWDGDEKTEDQLEGVCCFETLEQVNEYAKYSSGWIVQIGGDDWCRGYDFIGELLINEAIITGIVSTLK